MPFDDKVLLGADSGELIRWKADVDINDAMATRAGEVVVVVALPANTVVMRPVSKLDPRQQPRVHQLLHRTVDCSASNTRIILS